MSDLVNNIDKLIIGNKPDFSMPVVFLDFDGVINIYADDFDSLDGNRTIVRKQCMVPRASSFGQSEPLEIDVFYDQEVIDAIRDMNCVWLTSWKEFTQDRLNPMLDLDFGYVDWKYRGFSDAGKYGKELYVRNVVEATDCDWVVVDDEFFGMDEVLSMETKKEGLVIMPDSSVGLMLDQVDEIRRWVENASR